MMNPTQILFTIVFASATALGLAACHNQTPAAAQSHPTQLEQAQTAISRMKASATALIKLDGLDLEETSGLGETKRTSYHQKIYQIAFSYAGQYRKDLAILAALPHRTVDAALKPLLLAESTSPTDDDGIYKTIHMHLRLARTIQPNPLLERLLFWRNSQTPRQFETLNTPSLHDIIQDHQSLRYASSIGKRL
jgi:hypothetical protein